jgi:hypothetical protein
MPYVSPEKKIILFWKSAFPGLNNVSLLYWLKQKEGRDMVNDIKAWLKMARPRTIVLLAPVSFALIIYIPIRHTK